MHKQKIYYTFDMTQPFLYLPRIIKKERKAYKHIKNNKNMKNILFSIIITGASVTGFAQTWDFESWTGTEPTGWISANELMILPPNPQSAFQETVAANVHGGTKALKLVSVNLTNNPGNALPNPIGLAAPGQLVSFVPKFGAPFTSRPASVDFWYMYTPAANDTAEFLVFLWNSTTGDTLGAGYWRTGAAASSYTSQGVPITYNPLFSSQFPDSMALTFSSTKLFNSNYTFCPNCGTAGSTLWLDDITFNGSNGVNERPSSEGVTLFPNPAKESINISVDALTDAFSVTAYDATGRIISTTSLSSSNNNMNRKSAVITTSEFSSGLYSYCINDKNGTALRAGTFNVVR